MAIGPAPNLTRLRARVLQVMQRAGRGMTVDEIAETAQLQGRTVYKRLAECAGHYCEITSRMAPASDRRRKVQYVWRLTAAGAALDLRVALDKPERARVDSPVPPAISIAGLALQTTMADIVRQGRGASLQERA